MFGKPGISIVGNNKKDNNEEKEQIANNEKKVNISKFYIID